jgi:3-hydroxyisobutyrate dehydrogenase
VGRAVNAPPRVAFVGLGAMGAPMASRLVQAGVAVTGIDADPAVQARWRHAAGVPAVEPGAAHAPAPRPDPAAPPDVHAVVVCVTDEAASRAVFEHGLGRWRPGTLVIEHGTTSAAWALEADRLARAAGLRYCDAPISGGAAGAQRGELVAMLGAHVEDLAPARTLLGAYCASVVHLGSPGAGQLCKMANQLAIAGVAAGLAEAQAFSRDAGLDPVRVFDVLSRGAAGSVQLERLRDALGRPDGDARDTFAWLRKDLALCAAATARPLPLELLWRGLWNRLDEERR